MNPSDYPPPWRVEDAIAAPSESEPVEVDVLVVGAGPAPTIRIPTSIRSSTGSVGSAIQSRARNGGGESEARTANVLDLSRR